MNAGRTIDFADIFARAANTPRRGSEADAHVATDEDLLLRWSLGELTATEDASLLEHLADCPRCRREVAAMVRTGALVLPEPAADDEILTQPSPRVAATAPAPRPRKRYRSRTLALVAVAAALVLVVLLPSLSLDRSKRELALAHRDLAEGRPQEALTRVETLLAEKLDAQRRAEAARLLEESVYRVGREDLQQGRFGAVAELRGRLSRHATPSGRVENLAIQAEREVPDEFQFARAGSLTDYGYTLGGFSGTKALPTFDPKTESAREALARAVKEHPESAAILLNYGQFLLDEGAYEEARTVLNRAATLEPENPLAHLALGLLAFDESRFEDALQHFQRAGELAPDRADAALNQAITLLQLDRPQDAREQFQRAAQLSDEKQRERIEKFLKRM